MCPWHAETLAASARGAATTNRGQQRGPKAVARNRGQEACALPYPGYITHFYPPDREHTSTRSPAVRNSSASARPMPVGGVEGG